MNTTPDPPRPSLVDIEKTLLDLGRTERRAQLRALMPTIELLVQQGTSHAALANALTSAGLGIKAKSLCQALYRWRKRPSPVVDRQPASTPLVSIPLHSARAVAPKTTPVLPNTSTFAGPVSSKADLAKLRDADTIPDLNALAELGRRK